MLQPYLATCAGFFWEHVLLSDAFLRPKRMICCGVIGIIQLTGLSLNIGRPHPTTHESGCGSLHPWLFTVLIKLESGWSSAPYRGGFASGFLGV